MAVGNHDIRYSLRRLAKSPGFVAAVVLSIAIGIAANATIFSMISRFVLRPAPVGNPSTLLGIHTTHDGDQCCNNFPYPAYTDVRDQTKSFSGVAAYFELLPASIGGSGEPERTWGQSTTSNYFDVLAIPMTLGRGFLATEEHSPVVVISHELWQRRFASDPQIIDKSIYLSGHPYTVVGVAPREFRGLDLILAPQFWIPLGDVEQLAPEVPSRNSRLHHWLDVVARLKPDVTKSQADAELRVLAAGLAKAYPDTDKGNGFLTDPAGSLPPRDKSTFLIFLAALSVVVLLVLGIACANVSNLLIAQGAGRQREMAIRISLGATRAQLLRQMLIESLLLALAGGFSGSLISLWATSALSAFHIPAPVPLDVSVSVDWRVILYTFVLSVGSGLVFGLLPAWIASRPVLTSALKGETVLSRPGRRFTLRNGLVVAQIAMSLVLLCATGLFLRSLGRASTIDVGFRSRDLLMVSVDPRVHGYTPLQTSQFLDALRERVAAVPGVLSVAATDSVPLSGGNRSDGFGVEGAAPSSRDLPIVELYMVSENYFDTLGIPLVAGRDFGGENPTGPKLAVVNQAFAERLFPNDNAIGRRVNGAGVTYEVIGIVKNIKSRTLGEDTRPILFRSLAQTTGTDPSFLGYTLVVRTSGQSNAAALTSTVRERIHSLDSSMAIYDEQTMSEHLRNALFLPRLAGTLFGIFGFAGLVLAAVGLYGLMSYSVTIRRREMSIRIALGAQLGSVQRLVIGQGMRLAAIAILLGLPAAWAVARFSESFLYGIRPHDAATFTFVPAFLALVAAAACWIPARRASRAELNSSLRSE